MTVRAHDVVEGDLEHQNWLDAAHVAEVLERMVHEELRELGNLGVRQAGVSLADILELVAFSARISDGESVIAQGSRAPAIAELGGGDDDVEGGELALELEPGETAAAGLVDAGPRP